MNCPHIIAHIIQLYSPTHIHMNVHTHLHEHTHTHVYAWACTHARAHTHTHTHTHKNMHTQTCTHTNMHTHEHAHTHRNMHTHTHTHTQSKRPPHLTFSCTSGSRSQAPMPDSPSSEAEALSSSDCSSEAAEAWASWICIKAPSGGGPPDPIDDRLAPEARPESGKPRRSVSSIACRPDLKIICSVRGCHSSPTYKVLWNHAPVKQTEKSFGFSIA